MLDAWQRPRTQLNGALIVEGRSAAHHDAAQTGPVLRRAAHDLPQLGFGLTRDRTAVEDGDVGIGDAVHDVVTRGGDHRANGFGVVVVRSTPESPQIKSHSSSPRGFTLTLAISRLEILTPASRRPIRRAPRDAPAGSAA